jgi:hypothetical protein
MGSPMSDGRLMETSGFPTLTLIRITVKIDLRKIRNSMIFSDLDA